MYPRSIKYSFRKISLMLTCLLLSCCLALSVACESHFAVYAKSSQASNGKTLPSSLYVSGSPVGIRLDAEGVTVLGFVGFMSDGVFVNPGVNGGLKIGDCILKVNQNCVSSSDELRENISASKDGNIVLLIKREGNELTLPFQVYKDDDNGEYRIGVWVRDCVTGIGTMTFYDKSTGCYAALGHGISGDNGLVSISGGTINKVVILDALRGRPGVPGELKGYFPEPLQIAGDVRLNCECGVIGICGDCYQKIFTLKEYPVMSGLKVHTGKASILCTVCGDVPKEYEVEITAALKDRIYDTKGITLKVTDARLIESTGGIVQGMSGSPILQDGCIVGAVTHVTMNDPTVGYGIFIENMIHNVRNAGKKAA